MKSKILSVYSDVRRLLFGFALIVTTTQVGQPIALYVGLGYILFALPMCFLGESWQDRLFALLTAASIGFYLSIPLIVSIFV